MIDYWKYRKQKGKYSDASLEANGWVRATEDNLRHMADDRHSLAQTFFIHPRRSLVSWAIMYAQGPGALTSHVGVIVEERNICEALISRGVIKRPISAYADGFSYFRVSDFSFPREVQLKITQTAEGFIGTPYDLSRIARHAVAILSGWDRGGKANYSAYGDVLITLSVMAFPRFRLNRFARYAILLYLLTVSTGRFRRAMPHRGEWSRPQDLARKKSYADEWESQGEL
ncbi:hypothetical protein [Streptomyces sp. NPDC048411]|uniref:hypothetical protein n=1 Tax=Streptomyces sp. NPDC048411 TaxID=3157206 RepID=UPI003456A1DA